MKRCSVCSNTSFNRTNVLWDGLINEWQISPFEVDYINRQQGESCTSCGSNLRSIALAEALLCQVATELNLSDFVKTPEAANISILEINEAGHLTRILNQLPNYCYGAYPEVDMHALPYKDGTFDVVVHSDTLEHVKNPVHALRECKRVLKPGGALCFTIPVIVGRMTRSRDGIEKSYHGDPKTSSDDFIVQTEFGADAWTFLMEAGFRHISMHAVDYPASFAYRAVA